MPAVSKGRAKERPEPEMAGRRSGQIPLQGRVGVVANGLGVGSDACGVTPRMGSLAWERGGNGCPASRCRSLTSAENHIDTNKIRTSLLLMPRGTIASPLPAFF